MNALYTPIIKKAIVSDTRGDVLAVPIKSRTPETESNDDVAQEKEAVISPTTLSGISSIPIIPSIDIPAAEESITATAKTFSPVYKTNNGKKVIDKEATKKAFVAHFLPIYKKILQDKGISNEYARALVAQAGHESAWGIKPIGWQSGTISNNYIGIKVPASKKGKGLGISSSTWEEQNGKRHDIIDEFQKFNTIEDMANYHVNLLNNNRYRAFSGSVANFADRVKAGGYATDSKYVDKLKAAIASMQKGAKFVAPNTYVLDPYTDIVKEFTSKTYGPINLKEIKNRQAWAESNNNPNAVSAKGATGKFQIMPSTQLEYIIRTGHKGNLKDPVYNEAVRDWYFDVRIPESQFINKGTPTDSVRIGKILASYNAGPGNVVSRLNKAKAKGVDIYHSFDWLPYMPEETQNYVNFILRNKDTGGNRTNAQYKKYKK